ncbi:Mrp/NBP35 family ATP-binding protein [Deltaproteobacteria bacterium TL4]
MIDPRIQQTVEILSTLVEPKLKWNIIALNLVKQLLIHENQLRLEIHLVSNDPKLTVRFRQECLKALEPLNFEAIHLDLRFVNIAVEGISGVKNIVLVGSGKGGVGKSTIASNLALALKAQGKKVGLMDADIYGPSIPVMMGIKQHPEVLPDEYLLPIEAHGVKVMSIGLLVPEGKALPWRGQMASGTLIQFIKKTFWGDLDYLVIDLPPGTGDIQLTLAHKVQAQGIVIVSTPQEVALGDIRRAVDLYLEHKTPILAIVENMSGLICEKCGHENHPFVKSPRGLQLDAAFYLQLPLHAEVSRCGDSGRPMVISHPTHEICEKFKLLAREITQTCESRKKSDVAFQTEA